MRPSLEENLKIRNNTIKNSKIKIASLIIIITSIFLFTSNCSTKPGIDLIGMDKGKLEEKLSETLGSILKVDILNELAYRYSWDGGQKPVDYVNKAMELAKRLNYKKGEVDALCHLGHIYFLNGDFDESKAKCEEGLELASKTNYKLGTAMAFNGIARFYQIRGKYRGALEKFSQSEDICKNISNKKGKRILARAYYGLGALYYYSPQDYQKTKEYFEKHLKIGKEIDDKIIISSAFYASGEMYRGMDKIREAKLNFLKCLELSKKIGSIYNEANAYEGLGDIFAGKNLFNIALHYYKKSLDKFSITKNRFQIAENRRRLGKLYNTIGYIDNRVENNNKAFQYLEGALSIAKEVKINKTIERICEEITLSCVKLGKYNEASTYYRLLVQKKEFLSKNEISKLKLILDSEKKNEKEKRIRYYWISGFVAVVMIFLFVFLNLLVVRKQKKDLEVSHKNIERMSEIGQAITSSLSVSDIIDRVYENVNRLMDAQGFYIAIYNKQKQRLDLPGGREYGKEIAFHYNDLSEKNRLSVQCFNNELEMRIGNFEKEYHEYISEKLPPKVGSDFNSHILLPLLSRDKQGNKKKVGVIIVQSDQINAFSDYQYNILKNLAIYAAIALDNANAYKQIGEQKLKIEEQTQKLAEQTEKLSATLKKEKEISDHKDDVMHTVYHQYKTPLAVIDSSTQILKGFIHKLPPRERGAHFNAILTKTAEMTHLLDQLLKFGKEFNPLFYDLAILCSRFIEEIKSNEAVKQKIDFKSSGNCRKVKVDSSLIEIILRNLIDNSIKYSPAGSKIRVELKCDEEDTVIKVTDQGKGIPGDYLKMPFERFHRGSNVKTIAGTGLGLAIVKRYTEMHGGGVSIDSKINSGTTVTIRIPKK